MVSASCHCPAAPSSHHCSLHVGKEPKGLGAQVTFASSPTLRKPSDPERRVTRAGVSRSPHHRTHTHSPLALPLSHPPPGRGGTGNLISRLLLPPHPIDNADATEAPPPCPQDIVAASENETSGAALRGSADCQLARPGARGPGFRAQMPEKAGPWRGLLEEGVLRFCTEGALHPRV